MTRKEEREQAAKQSIKGDSFEDGCIGKGYFIIGAEWADRTMLNRIYDFCIANIYKYGKVKFIDNRATFDFRMNTFLNDLKQAVEE